MKIARLKIENALSHKVTDVTMDSLTVYRGSNGSGKSTIVQAISALLTGRTSFTKENGSGLESLIRAGEDKAVITAEVVDGGETRILRTSITEKSGRTPTCKKESDPSYTGTDYLAMLALKRDMLRVLIDGAWFFNPLRSEADQKELLASIILPTTVEFAEWVWPAMEKCEIAGQVRRDQKPFDLIQACYEAAYKERTVVNRYIKDWREPEHPAESKIPLADIRARLAERQTQRTNAAVKKQEILSASDRAAKDKTAAESRIETLKLKLQSEQIKRSDAAKGLLTKAAIKDHQKIAASAEKAKYLDDKIAEFGANLRSVRKTLAAFNDLGESGKCPTCTQPVTDEAFERICAPLIAEQDKLIAIEREAQVQRKELGDPEGAQKALDAHAAAERQVALIDEHIAEAEKELKAAEKRANVELPAQPDTSAIDAETADLDRRIEMGNQALQDAIKAETAAETHKKALAAKAALDAKREALERLIEYFGKDGISAKLLNDSVAPFEASMNKVLAGWGFECKLSFAPFEFLVKHADMEQFFPLKTMSESQQQMFRVAFQTAMAKVSGFGFVVIDRADVFLDGNRAQLYKNLMGSGLEQVIIMQSDDRRQVPQAKAAVFYMMSLDKSGVVPTTVCERL